MQAGAAWIDPRVRAHVDALADPDTGWARDVNPVGLPWQEPDEATESLGRTDLHAAIDTDGRLTETRSDLDSAFGDWESIRAHVHELAARAPERIDTDVLAALRSRRTRSRPAAATTSTWRWPPPTVRRWKPLPPWRIRCAATSSATTSPSW